MLHRPVELAAETGVKSAQKPLVRLPDKSGTTSGFPVIQERCNFALEIGYLLPVIETRTAWQIYLKAAESESKREWPWIARSI